MAATVQQAERAAADHQHRLSPGAGRERQHRVQRHAERFHQTAASSLSRIRGRGAAASGGPPSPRTSRRAGRRSSRSACPGEMPPSVVRWQNRGCPAAQRRTMARGRATAAEERIEHDRSPGSVLRPLSVTRHHLVTEHRRKGRERREDGAGVSGEQRHVGAADTGQDRAEADPVIGPGRDGWGVSVQANPGHPAAGHGGEARPSRRSARWFKADAPKRWRTPRVDPATSLGGQSIGTRRTMLGPTRSRISSRLWPVMVRPWFLRPMTARDGSGACRTSSATSSASSSVPQG